MVAWKFRESPTDSSLGLNLSPLVESLVVARGGSDRTTAEQFLFPKYERDLHDPFLFLAMEKVVERIGEARQRGETIGIFGDFDADGITSSVIIRECLTALGIPVQIYIPHKMDEGHGLNLLAIDFFERSGIKLILTLDCGMMNHAEIKNAKERGIATIIIDHHHVPPVLPEAFAIINPKLPQETYPFRELCGAGTSFKVATALYTRFLPEETDQLKWLLDVVATGTVADVMPLIGENRAIVKYGLIVLQKTRRLGFREMFAVGRIPIGEALAPDARMIAFQIAPRINAASRMAHPMLAHDLLMERDQPKARGLALELEAYNVARQKVSQATTAMIRQVALERYGEKKFIFAVGEEYPLGVIGLVAGRIAHEFGKPTCILQKGETTSTGSFRSIPGLSIIEALEECKDLVEKFGGHEQAAGMRIKNENLDSFYARFDAIIEKKLQHVQTEPELWIDAVVHPTDVTLDLARELKALEPFGEGNPEPVLALRDMTVLEARTVGKDSQHWKLKLKNGGAPKVFDAVGWSLVESVPEIVPGDRVDIAFQLSENAWNGRTTLQLKLLDLNRL